MEMIGCAVYGCTNNTLTVSDPTIQYFEFPKHPLYVQQWIAACWNADAIDVSTARICSVHFDTDSYANEYKMVDYTGCYAKLLKFDAVPTLFLPNSLPITLDELKNVVVYTLPTSVNIETTDPKYSNVETAESLERLREENSKLREELESMRKCVEDLRQNVKDKEKTHEKVDSEYNSVQRLYTALRIKSLPVERQKRLLAKVFSESQIKILSGKKKIYWSNDDMAVGYTIRHLSNKRFYTYLSKKLNVPLPALSSLKRWATVKKSEAEVVNKTPTETIN